jgi:hypothetical protein
LTDDDRRNNAKVWRKIVIPSAAPLLQNPSTPYPRASFTNPTPLPPPSHFHLHAPSLIPTHLPLISPSVLLDTIDRDVDFRKILDRRRPSCPSCPWALLPPLPLIPIHISPASPRGDAREDHCDAPRPLDVERKYCIIVCVCVSAREREKKGGGGGWDLSFQAGSTCLFLGCHSRQGTSGRAGALGAREQEDKTKEKADPVNTPACPLSQLP